VLAAAALAREHAPGQRASKRAVNRAVREVSAALGNTPAVARVSYIDPRVIDSCEQGTVTDATGRPLREEVERRVQSMLRS
jgi:DNA topoisomerase IB